MKIISGKLKGRVLKGYNIKGTRPTMDRVKESIFGSIQDYILGSQVLDLFAGSGNLGIEAISNGAYKSYFVDNNRLCIKVIEDNIKNFGIESYAMLFLDDYKSAVKKFGNMGIKFDIIFIDPPYNYSICDEVFKLIMDNNILSDNGLIIYEYQNNEVVDNDKHFKVLKNKKYGDKYVCIYKRVM